MVTQGGWGGEEFRTNPKIIVTYLVPHQTGQLISVSLVSALERGTKGGSMDISGILLAD